MMTKEPVSREPIAVELVDPSSVIAQQMSGALWAEIQTRYSFSSNDPFEPSLFAGPVGGFWVAFDGDKPVGSVALAPLDNERAELDIMYVAPTHRRRGIADALLAALEHHARATGTTEIVLRAGNPQPEALAFYRAAGYVPTDPFGRWTQDETALCFRKRLN